MRLASLAACSTRPWTSEASPFEDAALDAATVLLHLHVYEAFMLRSDNILTQLLSL